MFFVREMGALSLKVCSFINHYSFSPLIVQIKAARAARRTVDKPAPGTDHGPRPTDVNYESDDSLRSVNS